VEHQRRLLEACRERDGVRARGEIEDGLAWTVERVAATLAEAMP
jgi:hypothetical protein